MPNLRVKTVPIDLGNRHLAHLLPDADVVAWQHGNDGMVGWGCAWREDFPASHQFPAARHAWEALVASASITDSVNAYGTGLVAFGSFSFDPHSAAGGALVVPRVIVGRCGKTAWLTTVDCDVSPTTILSASDDAIAEVAAPPLEPHAPANLVEIGDLRDGPVWASAVEAVLERIAAGAAEKVVLARQVVATAESPLSPTWLLQRLNSRFNTTWNYAIDSLVGATPEMLVRVKGGRVESTVLAGTIPLPLSATETQIDSLATQLINSDKDLVEHAHAVDSVANALAPVCIQLKVVGPEILELPNILHLVSDVSGTYANPGTAVTSLLLAELLHPTAAVCGTPPAEALEIIREFEDFDRGRYSGPVGWINASGDGEWGIALRCAQLAGPQAHLFAACGIVTGSQPGVELMESEAKLNPLRWALAGDNPAVADPGQDVQLATVLENEAAAGLVISGETSHHKLRVVRD